MWKMFEDIIECNECGGLLGPPPKFMIPPPPRPPSMAAYEASTSCDEEQMTLKAQKAWESDMCEAIPILDAGFYSSQSLQTSAMIAVFSLLLVLVVLISSLFVWKNKRKVQNFLPCKTPTRGPHITGALSALASGHGATYEDPDAHLGHHRPLVMRHHHNVEMLQGKSIHYPSGYPMTRSPPFLVSNSPGPDPYRSNDNVYEELEPSRDGESDGESEPPLHSDDDFAEDELSLPGERSFNKPTDTNSSMQTVTTPYPERTEANVSKGMNGPERHSVLSSASSTPDASTATAASSNSSHNNNSNAGSFVTAMTSRSGAAAILSGVLRHTTARKSPASGARSKFNRRVPPAEDLISTASAVEVGNIRPIQQIYDNTSNMMALGYQQHHQPQGLHCPQSQNYHHSLHHIHHHNNNRNPNVHTVPHFYNTIESEVERRNRINAQLKNSSNSAVSTIFRERIQYPHHFYAVNPPNGPLSASMRARTNPRSMDRRRGRVAAPSDPVEPVYGYTEPLHLQNYHYESCNMPNVMPQSVPHSTTAYLTYTLPEYSSGSVSSYRQHNHPHHPTSQTCQNSTSLYGHGDSSFGSDSGYSHHTPASSIGRHEYDIPMPVPPAPPAPTRKPPSKLANALSFSWNKKKSTHFNSINLQPNTNKPPALSTSSPTEASSPNNNSGSSTITSTLENTSSSSSAGIQSQNNNDLILA